MRGRSIPVPRTTTSYSGAISSMVMASQEDRIRHDIKSNRVWSRNGVLELKVLFSSCWEVIADDWPRLKVDSQLPVTASFPLSRTVYATREL